MERSIRLADYPKQFALRDGVKVDIRPLEASDKLGLLRFFERIPEEERFYLKENVTSPEVIQSWTAHIDLQRVAALVAITGKDIVADGTLHISRAPARRHVGELRLVVLPDYREVGLGGRMIRELVELAADKGLHKVFFELVDRREKPAVQAAKAMGFAEVAVLQERVKDFWGNFQDVVILELPLKERDLWWRF